MNSPFFSPEPNVPKRTPASVPTVTASENYVQADQSGAGVVRAEHNGLHLVGRAALKPGNARVQRIKPKHMRVSMRKVAVRTFELHQSEEDAARAISEPGVTGRTILSAALLDVLSRVERLERLTGIVRAA